jgi:hypothetical protein
MYISIDIEADGKYPPDFSMVCFGAVVVDDKLNKTFYGRVKPISVLYDKDALAVSGFSRTQHMAFDDPKEVMQNFAEWLKLVSPNSKPVFVSDNLAYDWQWINYYFCKYYGSNPFGHSARRIGDLYCGLVKDFYANRTWKCQYRKTPHTHNPVQDCMGNAEALLAFRNELGLKIEF